MTDTSKGANLIFIMSPERSGSTMLQMMLESHSAVCGLPEPNVLPPLQYLGYLGGFNTGTLYEPVNQALGFKEFVNHLPGAEALYLEACRRYALTFYQKALELKPGAKYFLDKTPSNVLVWPLVVKMFPQAKYIILTRHPYAIVHSYAKSFFTGNFELMRRENTRIPEHIQAVAAFARDAQAPKMRIAYEKLVAEPETGARDMLQFLGLGFESAVVNYGEAGHVKGAMGDPLVAQKEKKPVAAYAWNWTETFKQDSAKRDYATGLLEKVSDEDLAGYGYPRPELLDPLNASDAKVSYASKPLATSYHFQRHIFFALKKWARGGPFRKLLEGMHYYCDVLLR